MNLHIALKFQYHGWKGDSKEVITMEEHERMILEHGFCYWGRVATISEQKYKVLKHQIMSNIKTYVFLYEIRIPKSVNQERIQWYKAEMIDLILGRPDDVAGIPSYYQNLELGVTYKFKNIQKITCDNKVQPKLPGRAPFRYVSFKGKFKGPDDLYKYGKDEKICRNDIIEDLKIEPNDIDKFRNNEILESLVEHQEKIIELQDEVKKLNEYREKYQKVIGTDYFFESEKILEDWITHNIHLVSPNLDIIDRQPRITWADGKFGRLDLLAFDKVKNNIVIIEVKTRKRKNKSGYDQYLRYTTWVKSNISQIKEKYNQFDFRNLNEPDFLIITDYVNDEMKAICENHSIGLIEIFGGLGINKVA